MFLWYKQIKPFSSKSNVLEFLMPLLMEFVLPMYTDGGTSQGESSLRID